MSKICLLIKVHGSRHLNQINQIIKELLAGLKAEVSPPETTNQQWLQLDISGEDETVASKLLEREIGICPVKLDNLRKFADIKGYVMKSSTDEGLVLDVGIFEPEPIFALIPLNYLQSHLAEGKKNSLQNITKLWGLSQGLPIKTKILEAKPSGKYIKAVLTEEQLKQILAWKDSLLDRLIIIGATLKEIEHALNQVRLERDIVDIERLGLFEYALVCKLGTDATGLISKIGSRLRKAKFTVFNPRKIINLS